MATTNHTPTIELSQYASTDKTSYLVNYNDDMLKIDTAIAADRDNITSAQSTADTAEGKADANKTSIDTLNGQINDPSGLADQVTGNSGAINTINSLIGNGEPTTTDKTIIGAINELDSSLKTKKFNHLIGEDTLGLVTSDGTETRATMLNKLYTVCANALSTIADDVFITGTATLVITGEAHRPSTPIVLLNKNSTLPNMYFCDTYVEVGSGSIVHEAYSMRNGTSQQSNAVIATGAVTLYPNDSTLVADGVSYALEVQFYAADDSIK